VVFLKDSSPSGEYPKILKSDYWKKIVGGLSVQKGQATFEGHPLITAKGPVTLPPDMPDGAGIH
jgi:aminoacyl tRNA synthase complex-interacting multifunctional protein 1